MKKFSVFLMVLSCFLGCSNKPKQFKCIEQKASVVAVPNPKTAEEATYYLCNRGFYDKAYSYFGDNANLVSFSFSDMKKPELYDAVTKCREEKQKQEDKEVKEWQKAYKEAPMSIRKFMYPMVLPVGYPILYPNDCDKEIQRCIQENSPTVFRCVEE